MRLPYLLALLSLTSCIGIRPAYIDSTANVRHVRTATVALTEDRGEGPFVFCSGFFVDSRTIVTASHCLIGLDDDEVVARTVGDSMHFVTVGQWNGQGMRDGYAPRTARVEAVDTDHDVALLRTESYQAREWFELADNAAVGERCYAEGHPSGATWTLTAGVVSAFRGSYVQCSAELWHGNSGGPVFDDEGHVIGVADAIVAGIPHLGLAVDVEWVKRLWRGIPQ